MAGYIGIAVSQSVGYAALQQPNARIAGMPGFGAGQIYSFDGGPHVGIITYSFGPDGSGSGSATAATSTSTGVAPTETSYALYGHVVPLSVFGVGRIGGDIISGPWIENGLATFCISFGVPADPYGTRTLREIAFDSEVVWENGAFNTEAFTFRFYPGRLDQAVDPLETLHFGADAVAYRPQILLWFENLPLSWTKFQKIPYVAAVIADSTGDDVNLGEAFTRLATSPWVGYSSDQFETIGVTDGLPDGGLIIAQDADFLGTIQQFARFYRNWNILQTDKLRIVDRGAAATADIRLDRTRLLPGLIMARGDPTEVPRVLELSTIDPQADFTIVPSQAARPREPVNVSASIATESVYLPMIMDSFTRQSLVTYTKYQEEVERKKVTGTAMLFGCQIEPGDLIAITDLGPDFANETFRVTETTHGANYTVEFTAESFLKCAFGDPYFPYVVLLMGYEDVDGSKTAPGLTDESSRHQGTAASSNDSQIDTSQFKFGTSSLLITGSSPLVTYGASYDWVLSNANSDQFTIECWVKLATIETSIMVIVGCGYLHVAWNLAVWPDGKPLFGWAPKGGGANEVVTSSVALATGTWYHIATDKDASGHVRIYVNGVMTGKITAVDGSFWDTPDYVHLSMGAIGLFGSNLMQGWVDDLRISKGIARYASDGGFPVPTSAYPRSEEG